MKNPRKTVKRTRAKPGLKTAAAAPAQIPEKPQNVAYCPPPDDLDNSKPTIKHLGGSKSDAWNLLLCNHAIQSGWFSQDMSADERQEVQTAILAFLAGVKPADPIEGMMAAQLYASHASAMDCYRRAMLPGQSIEVKQTLLTLAAKLTKANAAQVEALKKHRSNGQQKVTVEHVHVYAGGQAVVGNVAPGGSNKKEGQPYAVGYAERPEMRCENPEGYALPSSGNA